MTYQTLPRPVAQTFPQTVPQALLHLFAALALNRAQDVAIDQINALPGHLRRDLGLADALQSITFANEPHK